MTKFIAGLILGALAIAYVGCAAMPGAMITVNESKLGFDETVETINKSATASGWKVPKVYDLQKSLQTDGYNDITKLKVLSLCKPEYAHEILSRDELKRVMAMMPCRESRRFALKPR